LAAGKKDEAIAELRFAADHLDRPWQGTETHRYLGQACEASGRRDQAQKAYAKLAAMWPVGYWGGLAKAGMKR